MAIADFLNPYLDSSGSLFVDFTLDRAHSLGDPDHRADNSSRIRGEARSNNKCQGSMPDLYALKVKYFFFFKITAFA